MSGQRHRLLSRDTDSGSDVLVENRRFSVERLRRGAQITYRLSDRNAASAIEVWPQWGNAIIGFHVMIAGQLRNILYTPNEVAAIDGGIPVLWPFANRIRRGTFTWKGRLHDLRGLPEIIDDGSGNPIHGMVRHCAWSVDDIGISSNGLYIKCSLQTKHYPSIVSHFGRVTITLTYWLAGNELRIDTKIASNDIREIPMSLAFHPWFKLPLVEHASRDEVTVMIPARRRWLAVEELPTGELQDVSGKYDLRWPTRIGRKNYDDVFTDLRFDLENGRKQVVSQLYDPASKTLVEVGASEEFKNIVLFVPADRPRLICLEPQTSATDAVNLQHKSNANLIVLEPNRPFRASAWVRVTEAVPTVLAQA